LKRFIPAYLNEDFSANMLGCPTTPEKLKLLLSNYLIRCSQECGALVDVTNIMAKFRQDDVLRSIIAKAKAVLEAERLFFEGKDGHRRYVDGRYIEPNGEPSYQLFVKRPS
jgi:hypothetical protein